jgi:predicted RNA-binding Zn ribbon-like protein
MESAAIDLINSEFYDGFGHGDDRLELRPWREAFVRRWQIRPRRPTRAQWDDLGELRGHLRAIVERLTANAAPAAADIEYLNSQLRKSPICLSVRPSGPTLAVERIDAEPLSPSAQVARAFAALLSEGDPERIKVCQNAGCRWAFYDLSKNRARRWCDTATCANRMKARRHRARKAAARAQSV